MITPDYARLMARYNRCQNDNLYAAAATLTDADRRAERGAFFGSIHGTLAHLAWGDLAWMSRFDGGPPPAGALATSARAFDDWTGLTQTRATLDARIATFAETLDVDRLTAPLVWRSGALGRMVRQPLWVAIAHFFNHQTHHRGQTHALLTGAGARPGDTDLILLDLCVEPPSP